MQENFKSGFVTILGKPNVGKSTLLNSLIGHKIAIMSDKPQTTRNKILGIYTSDNSQIIFTDTPGIHKPHTELGRRMVESSYDSIKGIDIIFFMITSYDKPNELDNDIIEKLKKTKKPIFLIINKIDLLKKKSDIDKIIVSYMDLLPFKEVIPISAKDNTNLDLLIDEVIKLLPEGPKYFPDDMICDHPERFIVGELIREKILYLTDKEVPHSVAVTVDSMKESEEDPEVIEIFATIYVERDSQKKIIIGSGGAMIKKIKDLARRDIRNLIGARCTLDLWVKVKKDWKDRADTLRVLGYQKDNF